MGGRGAKAGGGGGSAGWGRGGKQFGDTIKNADGRRLRTLVAKGTPAEQKAAEIEILSRDLAKAVSDTAANEKSVARIQRMLDRSKTSAEIKDAKIQLKDAKANLAGSRERIDIYKDAIQTAKKTKEARI